ncbi:NADH-quinone oxidoreductase subunit D [Thermaerobacter sp. PB12/4term]|uniref:NADH-quinone oxidoreductase subunit D n=1 Tax=Thermaerobacter sp. PB12/4term TaxID=2293838 RepID=UPI000E3273FA|nr:NADH-quinone oxidoreductase subunit D [Thermaerobacter sp. PB12/4term]QIA27222.1 NADH-quinone oxidoreductase subunit D [Thermaerobacter sp. PB12/4term]
MADKVPGRAGSPLLERDPAYTASLPDPRGDARVELRYLDDEGQHMVLSMGPQHPSTHGVLRVVLTLEGETIVHAEPDIGFMHRNWEKQAEYRTYAMNVPFADRNDYIAPFHNERLICEAIERLLGVEVPERARWLRLALCEMERIASHVLWAGTMGLDLGAVTPFLFAWRDREMYYMLVQELSGGRLFPQFMRIGGLRNDTADGWVERALAWLDHMEREAWPEYVKLLFDNEMYVRRTRGIGVLAPRQAVSWQASGPVLRGCGVPRDLRASDQGVPYRELGFRPVVAEGGDVWARNQVRIQEILESVRLAREALRRLPGGPVMAKLPRALRPTGEIYHEIESPRGVIGLYLVAGGDVMPYRAHWRSPCFVHLQLLPLMARGHLVADMTAIIGSIDIVLCEVDR